MGRVLMVYCLIYRGSHSSKVDHDPVKAYARNAKFQTRSHESPSHGLQLSPDADRDPVRIASREGVVLSSYDAPMKELSPSDQATVISRDKK